MINGVIAICPSCGGDVTFFDHMIDAHKGDDGTPHLVWQHYACNLDGEVKVTKQTLKACIQFNDVRMGKRSDDSRELSEAEVELIEFAGQLFNVKTVADFGWTEVV